MKPHEQDKKRPDTEKPYNLVDEASEESFPASDAPSFTPSHAGSPERQKKERDGK